jgi:hypothetical protein
MSPRAVANRIEDLRQLYRLGRFLVRIGRDAGVNKVAKPAPR